MPKFQHNRPIAFCAIAIFAARHSDAQTLSAQQRAQIIPLVDHHQHVAGPTAITMQELDPPLASVNVPAGIAQLLHDRSLLSAATDPKSAPDVYEADAQMLDLTDPPWINWRRGRDDALAITSAFRPGKAFIPNHFAVADSIATVSGIVQDTARAKLRQYFTMQLHRGADGRWRIATEQETDQPDLPFAKPITAARIIQVLDDAGIRRAAILSTAYWLASGRRSHGPDEEAKVRTENDWMLSQVAQYPARLVGFCGVNPLRDYAVREIDRCAANRNVKGIKLHLGNSRVNFRDTSDLRALRRVFAEANARHLALVVHIWNGPQYGEDDARIFLDSILASAPDVPIQIAHLAGGGAFGSDAALGVFADAITKKDARVRNLWFDVATDATDEQSPEIRARMATRLRQIGLHRVVYGSDTPIAGRDAPVTAWAMFRRLPLTNEELRIVASNVAPYMR